MKEVFSGENPAGCASVMFDYGRADGIFSYFFRVLRCSRGIWIDTFEHLEAEKSLFEYFADVVYHYAKDPRQKPTISGWFDPHHITTNCTWPENLRKTLQYL